MNIEKNTNSLVFSIISESVASSIKHSGDSDIEQEDYINDSEFFSNPRYPSPAKLPTFSIDSKSPKKTNNSIYQQRNKERRTLSNVNYCSSCNHYIKIIEEVKSKQKLESGKVIATEKHLKQYDSLLKIKDERLQHQETILKHNQDKIEKKMRKILKERKKIEKDKEEIQKQMEYIDYENNRLEEEFKKIYIKDQEIQEFYQEIIHQKQGFSIANEEISNSAISNHNNLLISREGDIQRLLEELNSQKAESFENPINKVKDTSATIENFQRKKEKLKTKKNELIIFANSINELKEKTQEERKITLEDLNIKQKTLEENAENLKKEKECIKALEEKLKQELESVNCLKKSLNDRQEKFEKEKQT